MKRKYLILIIVVGALAGLYVAGRVTGALTYYKYPAASMEPTIPVNSYIITSNFKKPKLRDIVAFWRVSGENEGVEPGTKNIYAFRLVAIEGDSFQIKNGLALINNKPIEDSFNLYFDFVLPSNKVQELISLLKFKEDGARAASLLEVPGYATLTNEEYHLAKRTIDIKPYFMSESEYMMLYMNDERKKWTSDNYGPIRIPAGHFFVLGDNRHRALDSRFTGPIPLKNILGTVLNK